MARSNNPKMHPYFESLLALPMVGSNIIQFNHTKQYPIFQLPYMGYPKPGKSVGMAVNGRVFHPHYFDGDILGGTYEE